MITAMAKGARVSGDEKYMHAAQSCLEFIENKMYHNDCLSHTYRNKNATINAYLDDHACYAVALLDVFENSPDVKYLERARKEMLAALGNFGARPNPPYVISPI